MFAMKLNEEMFAIKLYELEQQYQTMQSRIRLCGRQDRQELDREMDRARREYRDKVLALQQNIKGCRSPAVAQLADAQLEFAQKMENLWNSGRLEEFFRSEKNCLAEDRAEAAALYAEYAIDYAVQAMQFAVLAALCAADQQLSAEKAKGENKP